MVSVLLVPPLSVLPVATALVPPFWEPPVATVPPLVVSLFKVPPELITPPVATALALLLCDPPEPITPPVAAALVPPVVVTVTFRVLRAAAVVIVKVAVRLVPAALTTMLLAVTPAPAMVTAVAPPRPVPVSVTVGAVPRTPEFGVIPFSAGTGGFGNMMSSFNHNCASFPEKPVSVGYTWNTDLSQLAQMFGKMSKAAACKNKFAAVETVNGRQCARIESSVHLPLNLTGEQLGLPKGGDMKFTAQIDMTSWFTLATGNLHKSKGKVSVSGVGDVSDGNGPAQHIEFSMDFNMDVNEIAGIAGGKTASYKTPSSMLPASSTPNKSSVIRTNG